MHIIEHIIEFWVSVFFICMVILAFVFLMGFVSFVVLWPFQQLAARLRRLNLGSGLLLCGSAVISGIVCVLWNPGWGIVVLGVGSWPLLRRRGL